MGTLFISFIVSIGLLLLLSWYLVPGAWARILLAMGRSYAGLKSRRVETQACNWHYLSGGSGPVLLAIHGFGGDADNWLKIAPGLTKKYSIIAPDLPGFGSSTPGRELPFDINSQVQRLRDFINALDAQPRVIVGNSMGGWIASAYAARYPQGLEAIWLLAPLGVEDDEMSSIQKSVEANEANPFNVINRKQFREQLLNRMFVSRPWVPYPLQVHYTNAAERLSRTAAEMFRQIPLGTESLESITARLDIPILLQWGDQDQAVDVSGIKALERTNAILDVRVQPGVGHLPMLETPGDSLRFFAAFCERHHLTQS